MPGAQGTPGTEGVPGSAVGAPGNAVGDGEAWLADADHRGFATRAVRLGSEPDPLTGAVVPPLHQVSTFALESVGVPRGGHAGYEYSRTSNPTRAALERCLAGLEDPSPGQGGRPRGFAFASGIAAEDVLLRSALGPGDHVLVPRDLYGGTYRLLAGVASVWGVEFTAVAMDDPDAVRAAILPGRTRLVWVESPGNPCLTIVDIARVSEIAHAAGALVAVDNTFATPYLQQPLALGADVVVHSTTKYCAGHSDVVGGALVVPEGITVPWAPCGYGLEDDLAQRVAYHQNAAGAISGPFDAWLVTRGLKTLGVRMDRHCDNAERVAEHLAGHPAVSRVLYPGLPEHPGHDVAAKQMRRFGGMVGVHLSGGEAQARALCERTRIFALAGSLGGVESLLEQPSSMSHASVAGTELEVPGDLVRLSVGIEDVEDLIADLDQALG